VNRITPPGPGDLVLTPPDPLCYHTSGEPYGVFPTAPWRGSESFSVRVRGLDQEGDGCCESASRPASSLAGSPPTPFSRRVSPACS